MVVDAFGTATEFAFRTTLVGLVTLRTAITANFETGIRPTFHGAQRKICPVPVLTNVALAPHSFVTRARNLLAAETLASIKDNVAAFIPLRVIIVAQSVSMRVANLFLASQEVTLAARTLRSTAELDSVVVLVSSLTIESI